MGRTCQDQITRYIKEAIDISGSYLIEDVVYSLYDIMPEEIQETIKFSEIEEKLNELKMNRRFDKRNKKYKKCLNYVA